VLGTGRLAPGGRFLYPVTILLPGAGGVTLVPLGGRVVVLSQVTASPAPWLAVSSRRLRSGGRLDPR